MLRSMLSCLKPDRFRERRLVVMKKYARTFSKQKRNRRKCR